MTIMKKRESAFTLLEIMLVISIIVILLGVAVSKLGNTTGVAPTYEFCALVHWFVAPAAYVDP